MMDMPNKIRGKRKVAFFGGMLSVMLAFLLVVLTGLPHVVLGQVPQSEYDHFEALGTKVESMRFGTEAPRGIVFTSREFFHEETNNIYYFMHVSFAKELKEEAGFTLQAMLYAPDGSLLQQQTAHQFKVAPGSKEVYTYNYLTSESKWGLGEYRLELLVDGKKVGDGSFIISPMINYIGNSSGNLNNKGLAAVQGDWLYFISNEGYLHRIRYNGQDLSRLTRDYASFLNVQGEWIYYVNNSNGDIISRIRIDGQRINGQNTETVIVHDQAGSLTLYNDWLYYINHSDQGKIYKIRTDGTGKTKLSEEPAHHFTIANGNIYFIKDLQEKKKSTNKNKKEEEREAGPVFTLSIQGGKSKLLTDDKAEGLIVANGWLYYINTTDKDTLYRLKTDGSTKEKLVADRTVAFYADEQMIFYQKHENRGRILYKLDLSTYETKEIDTKVSSKQVYKDGRMVWQFPKVYMNIVRDWLYYSLDELNANHYRMKTDQRSGGEKIEGISDWDWRR